MGRAMLIIVSGMLIALGYTYIGMSNQRSALSSHSASSAEKALGENMAFTGIQLAIHKFNESEDHSWRGPDTENLENGKVTISVEEVDPGKIIKVISAAKINNKLQKKIMATYDISKHQKMVPDFAGALSIAGGHVNFKNNNGKIHFNGNEQSGTCADKPGLTVYDSNMVDDFKNEDFIAGDPPVAKSDSLKQEDINDLIDALAPLATTVTNQFDWDNSTPDNPGVYSVKDYARFSGQDTGYGILIVRNDATLDIESDLDVSGQFEFNGLVIFENETNFSGTGKAKFNGSVMATSDENTTFDIQANGKFQASYNCQARDYAETGALNTLNTTLYQPLSIYYKEN